MSACAVCQSERQDEIEALGLEAMRGKRSWRSVAAETRWPHHTPIKVHMERHYVAPPSATEQAVEGMDPLVAEAIAELQGNMRLAPPEVKPFYAIAIQNLHGLAETKPSQQHLINALKAIHEVTGMRLEQRMMLEFARHAFPGATDKPTPLAPVIDMKELLGAAQDKAEEAQEAEVLTCADS